jgi:hypothetical protein
MVHYVGSTVFANEESIPAEHTIARSEMDIHANTTCFDSNFVPIYFTGQVYDVSPFMNEYQPMINMHIVGACTAFNHPETGQTITLEFHQGLWFGLKLMHSLINPNQCRAFGIQICDDPFDPHRKLGIYDPVMNTHICMQMHGSITYLMIRVPTWQELRDCPQFIMTNDDDWDPSTLHLSFKLKDEEK